MNVTELITSSARKQRVAKKTEEYVAVTNLDAKYSSVDDIAARLGLDADHATDNASVNTEVCGDGSTHCMKGTIFSPPFPNARSARGEIESGADFIKYFHTEDQKFQDCGKENISGPRVGHVMQEKSNSDDDTMSFMDLACLDSVGHGLSEVSNDVHMEDNECEEFDEFDPYFFIKNLPHLSSVVPTFRPMLLPRRTRNCPPTTLVLDLDVWQRPWCTLPLELVMMPISHFLLILTSWSIRSLFDAVPILKIFWRSSLACLRLLYSLPAKAFMLNSY